jgi:superfamily II DNA or RNA helicase
MNPNDFMRGTQGVPGAPSVGTRIPAIATLPAYPTAPSVPMYAASAPLMASQPMYALTSLDGTAPIHMNAVPTGATYAPGAAKRGRGRGRGGARGRGRARGVGLPLYGPGSRGGKGAYGKRKRPSVVDDDDLGSDVVSDDDDDDVDDDDEDDVELSDDDDDDDDDSEDIQAKLADDDDDDDDDDDEDDDAAKRVPKHKLLALEGRASARSAAKTKRYTFDADVDPDDDVFGDREMERRAAEAATKAKKSGPRIDRILADRVEPGGVQEFLVKWQGRSYLHTEWVTEESIVALEKTFGKGKIKRYFTLKPQLEAEADENGGPFDPDFTTIERVCAIKEVEMDTDDEASGDADDADAASGSGVKREDGAGAAEVNEFLGDMSFLIKTEPDNLAASAADALLAADAVDGDGGGGSLRRSRKVRQKHRVALIKWLGLPYTDATWEAIDMLDGVDEHVERFRRWNQYPPPPKPQQQPYQKFTESPLFKDKHQLRTYQLEGLNWLLDCWATGRGSILADEMGLGKTVQAVATLDWIRQHTTGKVGMLVLSPLSTIQHWAREFSAWTELNVITYQGSAAARQLIRDYEFFYLNDDATQRNQFTKFDVLLTSYEMITNEDWTELAALPWLVIVVDEAQRLKNIDSKLARNLRAFKSSHRILLTGTPLQNNITELWTLLNFIEPQKFNSLASFLAAFGSLDSAEKVQQLHTVLQPFLLRRLKEDVEKSIPAKEETVMNVELTRVQKQYYRAILDRNRNFLNKGIQGGNVPNLLNIMMQLRKLCCHPFLIEGVEERNEKDAPDTTYIDRLIHASGKLVFVDKLLPRLFDGKHKVLIFSQMIRVLDILEVYLTHRGYKYERLDGSVRGQDRQSAIDRFCKPDSDRFVFLLCTRAGGVGINLTAADTVIIFDSDWNPQNDIQAMARCHRIGQSKKVSVYRLVTGRTYEEEMFDRSSKKLGLDHAVLQSGRLSGSVGNSDRPRLSNKEVDQLLRHGAYHVFQDDDKAADEFSAANIDELLQRSKKVVWEEGGEVPEGHQSSSFSKAKFQVADDGTRDVALDDNNFWSKIMPAQKTPESLLAKFQENDDALLKDKASRAALLRDISELVYEAADAWAKGKGEQPTGADELTTLIQLCLSRTGWSAQDKMTMNQWLEQLDSTRRRRGRAPSKISFARDAADEAYEETALAADDAGAGDDDEDDEDDEEEVRGRSRRAAAAAAGGAERPKRVRSRKPTVYKPGVWTDGERQRFVETLFDVGAPNWDVFRARLDAPQRSDAEMYELARHVLQRCAVVATVPEDRPVFRRTLDMFIATGRKLPSPIANNERDQRPPPEIASDKFTRNVVRLSNAWARRLGELDRTKDLRTRIMRGDLVLPLFAVTPWWTAEHDVALVDAILRHGLHAFQRIADEPLFARHAGAANNRPADPAAYPGPKIGASATLATVLEVQHTLLLKYLAAVDLAAKRNAELVARAQLEAAADLARLAMRTPLALARHGKALYNAVLRHGDADIARIKHWAALTALDDDAVRIMIDAMVFRANDMLARGRTGAVDDAGTSAADSSLTYADARRCDVMFDLSSAAAADYVPPIDASSSSSAAAVAGGSSSKRRRRDGSVERELLQGLFAWLSEVHARALLARLAVIDATRKLIEQKDFVACVSSLVPAGAPMPPQWLPAVHDVALLRLTLLHGLGGPAWPALLADPNCDFYATMRGAVVPVEWRQFLHALLATEDNTLAVARVTYVVRLCRARTADAAAAAAAGDDDPAADATDTAGMGRIAMRYERPLALNGLTLIEPLSVLTLVSAGRNKRRTRAAASVRTQAVAPVRDVPRGPDGAPILPMVIGQIELLALGTVQPGSKWHTRQYIWPLGFSTRRKMACWNDRTTQRWYTSTITATANNHPSYRITHEDGTFVENAAASAAWREALTRIKGGKAAVSGPELFGMSEPVIKALIQELQGARQCNHYQWYDFGPAAGVAFGEEYTPFAARAGDDANDGGDGDDDDDGGDDGGDDDGDDDDDGGDDGGDDDE